MNEVNVDSTGFQIFLKFVDVIVWIFEYYSRIHYWIATIIFNYSEDFQDFLLSEANVALWLITVFSIGIYFALIFIPVKETSGPVYRNRTRIKRLMPLAIITAPSPLLLFGGYFLYRLYFEVQQSIKNIIFYIKRSRNKKEKETFEE